MTPPGPDVRLVTPDLGMLDAALDGDAALAGRLDAHIAEGWQVFPGALPATRAALAAAPASAAWGTRLFLLAEPRTLVGWGGFKGPPREGAVEVGYAIAPAWRGRGLATAAVRALLGEAWAAEEVGRVIAHTLARPGPSVRVLEKAGFTREGEVADPDDGPLWRFGLSRAP